MFFEFEFDFLSVRENWVTVKKKSVSKKRKWLRHGQRRLGRSQAEGPQAEARQRLGRELGRAPLLVRPGTIACF